MEKREEDKSRKKQAAGQGLALSCIPQFTSHRDAGQFRADACLALKQPSLFNLSHLTPQFRLRSRRDRSQGDATPGLICPLGARPWPPLRGATFRYPAGAAAFKKPSTPGTRQLRDKLAGLVDCRCSQDEKGSIETACVGAAPGLMHHDLVWSDSDVSWILQLLPHSS